MKRIALRIAVALLTFIIGVVSAALLLTSNNRQPQSKVHDVQVSQALLEPAEQFTPIGGFDGRTLGGGINCEIYRAADGSRLSYLRENYRLPAQAARVLRRRIKDAERVIERTPVRDESGRQIGERIVVLWRADPRIWGRTSVLWTSGSKSFNINAESLEHALEFERQHQEKR